MRSALLALLLALPTPFIPARTLVAQSADARSVPPVVYGDKAPYLMVLDHVTGTVRVEGPKGDTLDVWVADARRRALVAPLAAIPPDRPVAVRIENANPLLYSYSVRTETVRESTIRSCSQIGGGLTKGAVLTTMGVMQGAVPMDELVSALTKGGPAGSFWGPTLGSSMADDLPTGESALEDMVMAAAPEVEAYLDVVEPLVSTAFTVQDSLRLLARLADGEPAGPMLDDLRRLVTRSLPGTETPADVPGLVRRAMSDVGGSIQSITGAAKAVDDHGYTGAWAQRARRLAIRLEAADGPAVTEASLALQDALHRIDLARRDVTQTFVLAPDPDYRRITVELSPTATYPDIPRFKEGVDLFTEPSHSILCSVSIGFAFMDEPADYTDRGGTVGRQSVGEDLRATPSILVHLGVPAFPLLQAVVGVGIGVLRAPDFYAGASVDLLRPIMLNAGWVFQRTRRLPDGASLGAPFPEGYATVDDFPRRWGGAFFFGVSLRR